MANLFQFDKKRIAGTTPGVVGIDEAGRGCFAGPVVAGAVWCVVRTVDAKKHPEKYKSKEQI